MPELVADCESAAAPARSFVDEDDTGASMLIHKEAAFKRRSFQFADLLDVERFGDVFNRYRIR